LKAEVDKNLGSGLNGTQDAESQIDVFVDDSLNDYGVLCVKCEERLAEKKRTILLRLPAIIK
jgi:hypothetical protein